MGSGSGFVYLMANKSMIDIFKIGCTERSPTRRAQELSSPTGVPSGFIVVCYIETDHYKHVERELHSILCEARVNGNREFFHGLLHEMIDEIKTCRPDWVHSFCITKAGSDFCEWEASRGPH